MPTMAEAEVARRLAAVEAALFGSAGGGGGGGGGGESKEAVGLEDRLAAAEAAVDALVRGAPGVVQSALAAADTAAADGLIAPAGSRGVDKKSGGVEGRGVDVALLVEAAPRIAALQERWRGIDAAAHGLSAASTALQGAVELQPAVATLATRLAAAAGEARAVRCDAEVLLASYSRLVDGITAQTMALDATLPRA